MQPRLALNSRSSYLRRPSSEITECVHHQAQLHAISSFVLCTVTSSLTVLGHAQPASCVQWRGGTISWGQWWILICESRGNATLELDAVPQGQSNERDYLRTENGLWPRGRRWPDACQRPEMPEEGLGKGLGMGDALKKILWVLLQQKAFWNKRLVLGFRLNSSRNQLV